MKGVGDRRPLFGYRAPTLSQCRHIVSLPTYGRIRGCEVAAAPTFGLQIPQFGPEPTEKRQRGAVKDPMATRNCPVEFVAVPVLSRLDLAAVALYHPRAYWRVH